MAEPRDVADVVAAEIAKAKNVVIVCLSFDEARLVEAALRSPGLDRDGERMAVELLIAEQTKQACVEACRAVADVLPERMKAMAGGGPDWLRDKVAQAARQGALICAESIPDGVKIEPRLRALAHEEKAGC